MEGAELLLARDLEDIVRSLEKWAKKNGITRDGEFFNQVDRINNVSDTLKALHVGLGKRRR